MENNNQSLKNIAAALVAAQSEMGNAKKDSTNPFFRSKFADLNSVREAVIPVLNKHGISVLQPTAILFNYGNSTGGHVSVVRTRLLHTSGEEIISETEIVCADNKPQSHGSAISYARRYALAAILCIGSEDDDGESAQGRTKQPETKREPLPRPTEGALLAGAAPSNTFGSFRKNKEAKT